MSRADADRALALGADLVAIGRAAIGNADVPKKFARGEALKRTPFNATELASLGISDDFRGYLTSAVPLSSLNIVQRCPPSFEWVRHDLRH